MAGAIGPGDWIEPVVLAAGVAAPACPQVVGGHVYLCEELVWSDACQVCDGDHPGLHIRGVPRIKHGWAACEWRPVYRPRADLIQSLKQPAPTRELEEA